MLRAPFCNSTVLIGPRTDDAQQMQGNGLQEATDELMNSMTVMYMMIQEALASPEEMNSLSQQLSRSSPPQIGFKGSRDGSHTQSLLD